MSTANQKFKVLPQAWAGERRRMTRQMGVVLAVMAVLALAALIAVVTRGTRESLIVLLIVFLIGGFAVVMGLALGVFLRRMVFLDGRIETDGAHVWWTDFMPQKKYQLSQVVSAVYDESVSGIVLTLKSGKTARLPGPVENQQTLLGILSSARSQ